MKKNTFLVEDKMLRVSYKEYETFGDNYGHLYYKTPYSHYILDYVYRFTGKQHPEKTATGVEITSLFDTAFTTSATLIFQ